MKEFLDMEVEKRIWGHFEVIKEYPNVKVKELDVEPSRTLSFQRHKKRNEFWVIESGVAEVITKNMDDEVETFFLNKGDILLIPVGSWHQCINPGKEMLRIVEVQYGEACEEDDIERMYQ